MGPPRRKGYLAERKIRMFLHRYGWTTVRSGGSLGPADLVCLRKGKCILMQVKSTRKPLLYVEGAMPREIEGFPLYVVVDFGYGDIRVFTPGERISRQAGIPLTEFIEKC
jgi:Holliday junction resolvase